MTTTLDVDDIVRQAGPVLHQHGQEIQPFGHFVKLPIAVGGIGLQTQHRQPESAAR